jgi:hypothetical protein
VATEDALMLCDWSPEDPSEFDDQVYETVVPPEHHLREVLAWVDEMTGGIEGVVRLWHLDTGGNGRNLRAQRRFSVSTSKLAA